MYVIYLYICLWNSLNSQGWSDKNTLQDLDEKIEPPQIKEERMHQNENEKNNGTSKDIACCCTKCCCKFANHDKAHGAQQQQQVDKHREKSHGAGETENNRTLNPKKFSKQQLQQLREKNARTRMCLITGGVELVPLLARRRAMQRPISLSTTDVTNCPNANK